MILYKTIALQFGPSLETGRPGNGDLVGRNVPTEETRVNRRTILTELGELANTCSTTAPQTILTACAWMYRACLGRTRQESEIEAYVREVDFPRELVLG